MTPRSVSFGASVTMSMGGNIVHDVAEPAAAQDAATKNYVDTHSTSSGGSVTFAAPSLVFSTSNVSGAASTVIASNAQLGIFNLLGPVAQAFGDTSLTGSAAFAARQDHRHPMPATPVTSIQATGSSGITGSVTLSAGTGVSLTQSGSDISISATSGGGGTSAVVQLSRTVLSVATASFDITSISGAYNHLQIVLKARSDQSAAQVVNLRLNNDSTALYSFANVAANNSSAFSTGNAGQTSARIGAVTGSSGTANQTGIIDLTIPDYSTASFAKSWSGVGGRTDALTNGNVIKEDPYGVYNSTAAINRVTIFPAAGSFVASSTLSIYGIL